MSTDEPLTHQLADYQPPPDNGLALLYEDEHLLAIDKPAGLLSVPGRGERMADCLIARVQARMRWWCTGWTWTPPASCCWLGAPPCSG